MIPEQSSFRGCHVIILTALPVEREAVCAYLQDVKEVQHSKGTLYYQGTFPGKQQLWKVAVAEIGMGGPRAATETERAVDWFHPQIAFFVGVAGGLKDVKIGDVVAATKVSNYEAGKAETYFKPRPETWPGSYALEQRARVEAGKNNWLRRLGKNCPHPAPKAHVGPLAAGEKVIASKNAGAYQLIQTVYGDALAVEMEGHGFFPALHASPTVHALVIRGISDLIEGKSQADGSGSQERAARHAAAFAFEILANWVNPEAPSPRNKYLFSQQEDASHKTSQERAMQQSATLVSGILANWVNPEALSSMGESTFIQQGHALAKEPHRTIPSVLQKSVSELLEEGDQSLMDIIEEIPTLANSGQREDALVLCERILEYDSANSYASYYKGLILLGMTRYENALDAFAHIIRFVPGHSLAYEGQVHALQAMQRYEEALAACDQAINIKPDKPSLYHLKADILMSCGRFKTVIKTCDDWLHLNSSARTAYMMKGLAFISLSLYQQAWEAVDCIKSDDEVTSVLKSLILDCLGDHQKALEYYRKLADVDVALIVGAGSYVAEILKELGRSKDAIKVCNHALRQDPDDVEAYRIKFFCLLGLQRYEEALKVCDHLHRLRPSAKGEIFEYQAVIFTALGRYPEGLKACDQAIDLDSTIIALSHKALCLQEMGQNIEALEACKKAIRQNPGNPEPYLTQGKALCALGRDKAALKSYERCINRVPDKARAWYEKSKVLERLGNLEEAKQADEKARQLGYGNLPTSDV